jgi:prolyl-tRNA editing enzyme YbaK/EbsC (Cys-tRNA(Pro) deacylase)
VFIDRGLLDFPSICVGGGRPGVEVEMSPAELQAATGATVVPLAL